MAAEERRRVREQGGRPDDWDRPSTEELALEAADEEAADEAADELEVSRFQALLQDRRKIVSGVLLVLLLVVAIYVLFPKIVGAGRGGEQPRRGRRGTGSWSRSASTCSRSRAYVALFRGCSAARATTRSTAASTCAPPTRSPWPASPPRASSRPPAPAGSCSPTGRCARPGMPRRRAACRMVAFLVLIYCVYLAALVVFGVLLRHRRAARDVRRSAARSCPPPWRPGHPACSG